MTAIERVSEAEPAFMAGGLTLSGGFLVLMAAGVDALQAIGTAFGTSAVQATLTRERVWSARGVARQRPAGAKGPSAHPATGLSATEPAMLYAALVGLGSFLVQTAAGVDMLGALATAGGMSAVQGTVTRDRAFAPATVAADRRRRRIVRLATEGDFADEAPIVARDLREKRTRRRRERRLRRRLRRLGGGLTKGC